MIKKRLKLASAALAILLSSSMSHAVTLNLHNGGDATSLDPHKVSGDWENRIVGDIFEGLTTEDIDANFIPGQAASWTISDDGLVYTFKLRDDIFWSDGVPVTAADFEFAFKRLQDPKTAASYSYLMHPIKNAKAANGGELPLDSMGVKALDDKTFQITLENPAPFLLTALTHYTAYPVPKHKVEALGNDWVKLDNIVTNGPYKPVEWVPGSHVKSAKNDKYYGFADLKIDDVIYYTLEDQSAALKRYRAGEFDILTGFPKDQYEWLKKNYPGEAHVAPFAGLYYYVMNSTKPPLNDVRVRQALSMAVNREVIGPKILGTGELPAYSWVPPGMANYKDSYNANWKDLAYGKKVAQAKALMTEAGFSKDKPLEVQLRYNTNENHKRIAIAIAAMWKAIGVKVELYNAETKVHYADLKKGELEIARAGWLADYNDPVNFLSLLRSDVGDNYGRWNSPEFDKLLDQAALETDLDKRAQLLFNAEKLAIDDSAAIPIYYYLSENVVSPKIKGFKDNAFDVHRTRWMSKVE